MTLKDHVEIIANPVVMAMEEKDGTELYRGYRGCFEFEKNRGILEREVKKMSSVWTYNISPKLLADYTGKDIEKELIALRERK